MLIAEGGHTYVYGGADRGLMKVLANIVESNGGKIIGVSFEFLRKETRKGNHELIIEKDLVTRKATIISRSDAFIVLPGGIGTLDEITEILELKKHRLHDKPIAILNTNGFYDGLEMQFERMSTGGFLPGGLSEYLFFAQKPQEAMNYLTSQYLAKKLSIGTRGV